ncbi:hypothetical protein ACOME3_000890 [Neoechinorhynchus agilis]
MNESGYQGTFTLKISEFFENESVLPKWKFNFAQKAVASTIKIINITFLVLLIFFSNLWIFKSTSEKIDFAIRIRSNEDAFKFIDNIQSQKGTTLCWLGRIDVLSEFYSIQLNKITLSIFIVSIIWTFLLAIRKRRCQTKESVLFNPFSKTNRLESACVYGILAIEILHSFEKILIVTTRTPQSGPLLDLFRQIGIVILIGTRYLPIIMTLELNPNDVVCSGSSALFMWTEMFFQTARDAQCGPTEQSIIQIKKRIAAISSNVTLSPENVNGLFGDSVPLSSSAVKFRILRQLPYYIFASLLAKNLSTLFVFNILRLRRTQLSQISNFTFVKWFVKRNNEENEINYVQCLFKKKDRNRKQSGFKFSKQIINLWAIGFASIHYFTFWTIQNVEMLTDGIFHFVHSLMLPLVNFLSFEAKARKESLMDEVVRIKLHRDFRILAIICSIACTIQSIEAMRSYKRHMISAFKGRFEEIPKRKRSVNANTIIKAVHFPGFMIGYLIWGYLILVMSAFILWLLIRSLIEAPIPIEIVLRWILPVLILFILKLVLVKLMSRSIFTTNENGNPSIENIQLLYAFNFFNFFFDCFIGMVVCVWRVAQTTIAALVFMTRIDRSSLGRGLECYDKGFAAYASWIHLESQQTNPVMLVFCQIVSGKIKERRSMRNFSNEKLAPKHGANTKLIVEQAMENVSRRRRAQFRFCLLKTLTNNPWMAQLRKQRSLGAPSIYKEDYSLLYQSTSDSAEISNCS